MPDGRKGRSSHSSFSGSSSQSFSSSRPQENIPFPSSQLQESSPSSSSLPQVSSGGYQGLAAIAGNLAASLSDMLGSDTDDVTLVMEDDAHEAQQAQHGMPCAHAQQGHQAQQAQQGLQAQQAQQGHEAHQAQQAKQGNQAQQGLQAQQVQQESQAQQAQHEQGNVGGMLPATVSVGLTAETETSVNNCESAGQSPSDRAPSRSLPQDGATGSCPMEVHASALAQRLQERAAAAMALLEAATAPSSIVSGLTDLQAQSVSLPAPALGAADPQLVRDSTHLHTRAPAAIAALEAATAASSTVSGLTELQMQAAPYTTAETASISVSGLSGLQARAAAATASDAALLEAAGAASSTVSGITELVAAGASLVDIAAALSAASALPAADAHPFGLSSAHSVDGYALANALIAPSSVVSDMTELLTQPPATVAVTPSDSPHESGVHGIAANHLSRL